MSDALATDWSNSVSEHHYYKAIKVVKSSAFTPKKKLNILPPSKKKNLLFQKSCSLFNINVFQIWFVDLKKSFCK